ncbi:hypothetical protein RR48_13472 [Papilio machaon]|uniref:Circadian clock-controlled protein n=1 Tax=Papilio machaon TaxID=76193 RepID=A0A194REP2_PAPMA|nr:hypothetical protein RR48_13472 [Papilio machaon]
MQIAFPYIADGISEIGVPRTDPMNFENITMWTEQNSFRFTLPYLQIRGGRRCKVVEFRQLRDQSALKLIVDCPLLGTGTYKLNGKMLIFDIDKEGDYKMQTIQPLMNVFSKDKTTILQIGEPIESSIVKNLFNALKVFFNRVPIDEFLQH